MFEVGDEVEAFGFKGVVTIVTDTLIQVQCEKYYFGFRKDEKTNLKLIQRKKKKVKVELEVRIEIETLIDNAESDMRRFALEVSLSKDRPSFNFWLESYSSSRDKYKALIDLQEELHWPEERGK